MAVQDQRTARLVGWFFIGTFVFSIPGYLLYGPLLDHHDYILGSGSDHQIAAGAFLEVLTAVCNIATAVVLYPVVRRMSPRLGLGYVASRVLESTIIVAGLISVMAVITLRQDLAGTGVDAASLTVTGRALVAFHDWTFLLGPGFCAGIGNGVILGLLMYRTGLIPRRLAYVGLIGGPLAIVAASGSLLGLWDLQSTPQGLLTVPEIIWEASFGLYLVSKGFKPAESPSEPNTATPAASGTPALA